MKLSKNYLKKLIKEEFHLMMEQDEDPLEDAEEGEETEGDEEGAGAEDEAEVEAEEVEPAIDEIDPLAQSVDDELNALFIDFETNAIGAAKTEIKQEQRRYSLVRVLYEQEEIPEIDMETFAGDVARLVQNYDSLLDMKAIIVKKAGDYITDKYGPEMADALEDILDLRFDISLEIPEDLVDPMAVGASTTAAEGGI